MAPIRTRIRVLYFIPIARDAGEMAHFSAISTYSCK